MGSPAAVAAALAAAVVPARVCLLVAFRLWFWLVRCEGRCCSLRLKAGCMLGMLDCGQVALGDLSPITAIAPPMGVLGRCLSGILQREAVLLLDRASAVQLPLAGSGLVIMGTYDCSF